MHVRRKLIIGNWKMHGSLAGNAAWFAQFKAARAAMAEVEAALCVPAVYLAQSRALLQGSALAWGAQDLSAHTAGAHTGELAAQMLADFGCRYVIVGHCERRREGESDALVAQKAVRALQAGMAPVVCLGETLAEREAGHTAQVVGRQLGAVLGAIDRRDLDRLTLAYEPVWSIGTGHPAGAPIAQQVHAQLRDLLRARCAASADKVRILYGGSMNADNAAALLAMPDIDGGLVGSASLRFADFAAILAVAAAA